MEWYYLFLVIVLLITAILDLTVGVANDSVNFLGPAYGTKVVKYKYLLFIAIAGLLIGAIFGGQMMGIARKGIFNPQMFTFNQVMIVFVVAMMSDIILLNIFNAYGLPTSTTVSMVFNLLGAAFGVALAFIIREGMAFNEVNTFINISSTLTIITGIFLSIVFAFIFGYIIQWITRIIFSYNYLQTSIYIRSLFNSICIIVITYFIFLKGIKNLSFLSADQYTWLLNHLTIILIAIGIISFIILFLAEKIKKYNSFNVSILYGTFALAMAFASNDLVNFIGIPLAGLDSFQIFTSTPGAHPDSLTMEALLNDPNRSSLIYLLIAGLIMSVVLYRNKKLKTVVETSVRLSQQSENRIERFNVNPIGRMLVDFGYRVGKLFSVKRQTKLSNWLNSRFDIQNMEDKNIAFDKVRASVNLLVSSSLIAFGTSLKLPLSTTYVTFIVAMGSAFADKAWGRDTAVYRVSGVVTVIGGWFLTAFLAFLFSGLLGLFAFATGFVGVIIIIGISVFVWINSNRKHRQVANKLKDADSISDINSKSQINSQVYICEKAVFTLLKESTSIMIEALKKEKISLLKDTLKNYEKIKTDVSNFKILLPDLLANIKGLNTDEYQYFLSKIEYLDQILDIIYYILNPTFLHLQNRHKPLTEFQLEQLKQIFDIVDNISEIVIDENKELNNDIIHLLEMEIVQVRRNLIAISLSDDTNIKMPRRATILVYNILNECDNLVRILYSLLENNYKKTSI